MHASDAFHFPSTRVRVCETRPKYGCPRRRELHAVARLHDVKRGREAIGEAVRCLRADMTGSSDRIRVAIIGNSHEVVGSGLPLPQVSK